MLAHFNRAVVAPSFIKLLLPIVIFIFFHLNHTSLISCCTIGCCPQCAQTHTCLQHQVGTLLDAKSVHEIGGTLCMIALGEIPHKDNKQPVDGTYMCIQICRQGCHSVPPHKSACSMYPNN